MHVVDRRLNPGGKSHANRQRFLRRAKAQIQKAVNHASGKGSIKDLDGGKVTIPIGGIDEPRLRRVATEATREHVLPGNKKFVEGDAIQRPRGGQGGGGSEASEDGEGEDGFSFVLSREEFLDIFLDDLELPDLTKKKFAGTETPVLRRAGYSVSGSPASISVPRTMRNSLARRIALKRPSPAEIAALEARFAEHVARGEDAEAAETRAEIDRLARRTRLIPYVDPLDLRYRRFEESPRPMAKAVMFCLMDVSGSMTENMKDLAKRFYTLLYLFLTRRYKKVEIVFIRHTSEAKEVDEETFFYGKESGGTMVSSAFREMKRVVEARYDPSEWNIYAAQASDGDNFSIDDKAVAQLLLETILPMVQYFAYIEVADDGRDWMTSLWLTYKRLSDAGAPIAMRKVGHRRDIFPVFRDLFQRQTGVSA